jgi:hypothetical protein
MALMPAAALLAVILTSAQILAVSGAAYAASEVLPSAATGVIADAAAVAEAAGGAGAESGGEAAAPYRMKDGAVQLTLTAIYGRIKQDNEEYKVSEKRVEIYQRRHSVAMHDKFTAENGIAPIPAKAAERVAWELKRYTDWQHSELNVQNYQNQADEKLKSIKTKLKQQYDSILDLEKSIGTYNNELTKLASNIEQLKAQIAVGLAKASDMDAYDAQAIKLQSDIEARQRDIDLAKFNLKSDLKIDQSRDIQLAPADSEFRRYEDKNIAKDIAASVEASFTVYSGERNLELLREERAIMLMWDKDGAMTTNLQNNEVSIQEAQYSLINARVAEEAGLWADYYALLNQEDQIDIERLNVKLAETEYNVTVAKLNQGMAKNIDEQNTRIALEEAKTTLQSAINKYAGLEDSFRTRLA